MKKSVELFFYSSLFISLCAIALCIETNILLHIPFNKPGFYLFVFGGVMVQYNLHYYLKKKSNHNSSHFEWSKKNRRIHLAFIIIGSLIILAGILTFHLHHFFFLLMLGIITLLYSLPALPFSNKKRLKDFGVVKIFTLVLLWTMITAWFPADQLSYKGSSFAPVFFARFIFLFILCLVFDIRDMEVDKSENIRTLPVMLGIKKTYWLIHILLAAFFIIVLMQQILQPVAEQFNAMLLSVVATFFVIKYVKRKDTDFAYLTCIDGMMLLQALLVIISSI